MEQETDSTKTAQWIEVIASAPSRYRAAVEGLSAAELDTAYRPEGWTIRQVVHHVADSHMNSYIRFKVALTEDQPAIRPYFEDRWGELPDAKGGDVELSLALIDALHARWVVMLRGLNVVDLQRTFYHPESKEVVQLDLNIGIYAWHSEHHLAHIALAKAKF
jgi:hypothetical protein